MIDHPGTLSPDTDHAGPGPVPVDQNFTPTTLPAWTDEPGLDNPAFEESTVADGMSRLSFNSLFDLSKSNLET